MRFCQFYLKDESRDRARVGVQLAGGRIAALADVAPELAGVTRTLDLLERLDAGDLGLDALRDRVAALDAGTVATWALDDVRLDAPLTNRIDYVWVTPGITVKRYGVLNDMQYGRFPSDHFPVVIDASF